MSPQWYLTKAERKQEKGSEKTGKRKRSGSYYYSKNLIWIFLEKKIKHLLCHQCQQSINSVS